MKSRRNVYVRLIWNVDGIFRTDKRYDMKNIVVGAFRSLIKIKKEKGMNKAFLLFKYSLFSIKIKNFSL